MWRKNLDEGREDRGWLVAFAFSVRTTFTSPASTIHSSLVADGGCHFVHNVANGKNQYDGDKNFLQHCVVLFLEGYKSMAI